MVLLLTATVKPNCDVKFLKINCSDERLVQYKDCLEFFLRKTIVNKIVLCDNSNVNKNEFYTLLSLSKKLNKKLEIISFEGNTNAVSKFGKGYGEGEIVEYAILNSKLLNKDSFFVKLTGRLYVDNINQIWKKLKSDRIYINATERSTIYANTRMYAMSVADYNMFFRNGYKNVDDSNNVFLENIFKNIIINNGITIHNFPYYPKIRGISGSTGATYRYNKVKCVFKDLNSFLFF